LIRILLDASVHVGSEFEKQILRLNEKNKEIELNHEMEGHIE
jgi:hypothetical protein